MDTLIVVGVLAILGIAFVTGFIRRLLRIQRASLARTNADEDPNLYAVAMRAWETGKPVVGSVDEDGKLTMREVEQPER